MTYTTPNHTGGGARHAQLTELCLDKSWSEKESTYHPPSTAWSTFNKSILKTKLSLFLFSPYRNWFWSLKLSPLTPESSEFSKLFFQKCSLFFSFFSPLCPGGPTYWLFNIACIDLWEWCSSCDVLVTCTYVWYYGCEVLLPWAVFWSLKVLFTFTFTVLFDWTSIHVWMAMTI